MIDKEKHYRTQDGREARIYAVDGGCEYPVHGAVRYAGSTQWIPVAWTAEGRRYSVECDSGVDLIAIKPRIKRTIWVACYEGYCTHSLVKPVNLGSDCIACVEVNIDCEHGEGLKND